jgi:hypothetical protein
LGIGLSSVVTYLCLLPSSIFAFCLLPSSLFAF